jgi:hypothetical protein
VWRHWLIGPNAFGVRDDRAARKARPSGSVQNSSPLAKRITSCDGAAPGSDALSTPCTTRRDRTHHHRGQASGASHARRNVTAQHDEARRAMRTPHAARAAMDALCENRVHDCRLRRNGRSLVLPSGATSAALTARFSTRCCCDRRVAIRASSSRDHIDAARVEDAAPDDTDTTARAKFAAPSIRIAFWP